jgi:hypothetical protein
MNTDWLGEILVHDPDCPNYHSLHGGLEQTCTCNYFSTKAAILKHVEEIIGEDEWDEANIRDHALIDIAARNELRAEQRRRAGL